MSGSIGNHEDFCKEKTHFLHGKNLSYVSPKIPLRTKSNREGKGSSKGAKMYAHELYATTIKEQYALGSVTLNLIREYLRKALDDEKACLDGKKAGKKLKRPTLVKQHYQSVE